MLNKAATVLLSAAIVSMGISAPLLAFADMDGMKQGDVTDSVRIQVGVSENEDSADAANKTSSAKETKDDSKSGDTKSAKSTTKKNSKALSKNNILKKAIKKATKKVIEPVKDTTERSSVASVSANIVVSPGAVSSVSGVVKKSAHKFNPSAPARADIEALVKAKILTNDSYNKSFSDKISAAELNEVMHALYGFLDGQEKTDLQYGRIEATYDFVSGKIALPVSVERGEAMGALASTAANAYADQWINVRSEFFGFISENSIGEIHDAYKESESAGDEVNMSREELFMLVSQFIWKFETEKITKIVPAPDTPQTLNVSGEEFYKKDVYLYWTPQERATSYIVRIYNGDGKIAKKLNVKDNFLNITADSNPSFQEIFGEERVDYKASYTVQAASVHGLKSRTTEPLSFTALRYDSVAQRFGSTHLTYKNGNEGSVDQSVIAVSVWHDVNGKTVPATATFSVNKQVAEGVKMAFGEYYNGSERFPIQSIGGFSHREKRSEHNYGTAIDINPNENYMVGPSGIQCGSFWDPVKSKYSIPSDSELVKAFERHGWYWAGYGWGSTYDYMHFSYQGT